MRRKRIMMVMGVVLGLAVICWFLPLEKPGMALARRALGATFSRVPQVSAAELENWLQSANRIAPQLLDVRTEAEFAVSHLTGARRIEPEASAIATLTALDTNRPVVVYCAVGYRALKLAERLQAVGLTNVFNLNGAIFGWASEGRPLECAGNPVTKVHPYNWAGRKLLEKKFQAD